MNMTALIAVMCVIFGEDDEYDCLDCCNVCDIRRGR